MASGAPWSWTVEASWGVMENKEGLGRRPAQALSTQLEFLWARLNGGWSGGCLPFWLACLLYCNIGKLLLYLV